MARRELSPGSHSGPEIEKGVQPEMPDDVPSSGPVISESTLINRVQLLLAEKRTSLAAVRTGIVLLTLPMSIVALLVTTSGYYDPMSNLVFLVPLFLLNTILVVMGLIMVSRAWIRIRKYDRLIEKIRHREASIEELVP